MRGVRLTSVHGMSLHVLTWGGGGLQSSAGLVGQHRCPDAARHRFQHSCGYCLRAFAQHDMDMLTAPLLGFDAKRCQL